MTYSVPESEDFIKEVLSNFAILIERFQYHHSYTVRYDKYYAKVIYQSKNRRIVIENCPWYTNYGYTIWIHQLPDSKQNWILYNLPWERENKDCKFVIDSFDTIFDDPEIIATVKGEEWIKPKNPFQGY